MEGHIYSILPKILIFITKSTGDKKILPDMQRIQQVCLSKTDESPDYIESFIASGIGRIGWLLQISILQSEQVL
jgi:hypothetical protein